MPKTQEEVEHLSELKVLYDRVKQSLTDAQIVYDRFVKQENHYMIGIYFGRIEALQEVVILAGNMMGN